MFTWNIQFVSRKRLADTLNQLMISEEGDRNILIRIHTAVHTGEEAADLAAFIKGILPEAQILGTSTSAIISEGKLIHDQCLISVTQMDGGNVETCRIPLQDGEGMIPAEKACALAAEQVREDTKLLFAFAPESYRDIEKFVNISNDKMPGVQMLGGVTDWNDIVGGTGFVFDEKGWSGEEMILAALSGGELECCAGYATGVQVVGGTHEITEAKDNRILGIDGKPAAAFICEGLGKATASPDIGFYFPLAYSFEGADIPFVYGCKEDDGLNTNHTITAGRKIRRGFFYDRKIIADNRSMFSRMEGFEKGETLFGYSCRDRFRIYPNSVNWELSAYQNSNCSGCLTRGEIGVTEGRKAFTNCAFAVAAAGENPETQQMNPYVFSHTGVLAEDNQRLIGFLAEAALNDSQGTDAGLQESMKGFVESCRQMLLYTEKGSVANEAALHMDIQLGGYDRVCLIDVPEQRTIHAAFSEQEIEKTHSYFLSECSAFAAQKNYRVYLLQEWQMAVAVPGYMVSLEEFTEDMKELQNRLFQPKDGCIPVVSVFCVIDECTSESMDTIYNAARLEMIRKNLLFYSCNGKEGELDEERILEKYRMVHVINDALSNDAVIPYYQGIFDNETKSIHHYEALMRLKDMNGKVYSPYAFLDVARSYGLLYDKLNREMLRKVFEKFRDSEGKCVSVNLGMRDIRNEELTRYIYSFLSTAPHPENFIFEILENEDVDDYETLLRFVDNIHKLGGKISIDDFGSGYSNLLHVISIPNDYLKIDGSIVKECNVNPASEGLVKMISGWYRASGQNAKLIAEYVENEAIQKKLLEYGIDYSQGYLFSKPAPEVPENEEK